MNIGSERWRRSGRTMAQAATLIERAAHTLAPSTSTLGRMAAAVTVARLGARLIPAAARSLRRYPLSSLLVAAGLLGALYVMRAPQLGRPSEPVPRLRFR
jgi:hypothetical protein